MCSEQAADACTPNTASSGRTSSSEFKVATFNIWNEGTHCANGVFRLALSILEANIENGLVGLAEVRFLRAYRNYEVLDLGRDSRPIRDHSGWLRRAESAPDHEALQRTRENFPVSLAAILNAMELHLAQGRTVEELHGMREFPELPRDVPQHWTAPTQVDFRLQDVGLLVRNADPAAPAISLLDRAPDAVVPLVEDRGSASGFHLRAFGVPMLAVVAHLDYKAYYVDYLDPSYVKGKVLKDVVRAAAENEGNADPEATDKTRRLMQAREILKAVDAFPGAALLMGDFNTPSHLDWQQASESSADVRIAHGDHAFFNDPKRHVNVAWPVTRALADGGFVDLYRHVHPSARDAPGLTNPATVHGMRWLEPSGTAWYRSVSELDRLDYIMLKGEVQNGTIHVPLRGGDTAASTSSGTGETAGVPDSFAQVRVTAAVVIGGTSFQSGGTSRGGWLASRVRERHSGSAAPVGFWPSDHYMVAATLQLTTARR